MSLPGYHCRYLRVDLSSETSETVALPEDILRRFIGGSGLGTWILRRESSSRIDALSPDAPLIFVFSPLVGSPLTTSAKFAIVAKSPLTERINDSLSSSHFAITGKKTGFDAIVIVGAAKAPRVLVIDEGQARFESAAGLWGLSSAACEAALQQRMESGFRFAAIGCAGENLVSFATISHQGRHAGRGGLGAVMGSKQLKAIAVRGTQQTQFAHPDELIRFSRELSRLSFGPATEKYRELGTVSNLLTFNRLGTLPTRNFQAGSFEGASALSPEVMSQTHRRTRESCAACTIGCEHIFHQPGHDVGVRMEYENLFALGPLCGISDADVVLQASRRCDELGLDTISAGGTIAFAMECAERGFLSDEPELRFGNGAALLSLLDDIAHRRGLGELLSRGSRAAAIEIGHDSLDFAPQVKGLELPGYEPRALQTMALGLAVGTRGADHNRSGAYQIDFSDRVDRLAVDESAALLAIETEDEAALMDSLILCKFLRGVFDDRLASMAEMLRLVTGSEFSSADMTKIAERIVTTKKLYNIEQGWQPTEDTLPRRFLQEPLAVGASAGATLTEEKLQRLVRAYNSGRHWTPEGWLPEELLHGLQIEPRSHAAEVRGQAPQISDLTEQS